MNDRHLKLVNDKRYLTFICESNTLFKLFGASNIYKTTKNYPMTQRNDQIFSFIQVPGTFEPFRL